MSDISSSSSSSSHWTIEFFGPKLLATAETNNDQLTTNPTKEVILSTKVISAINDDADTTTTTRICNTKSTTTIVGLYFSASWCPPCKTFTPLLIDFYNTINSKNNNNGGLNTTTNKKQQQQPLEIVFVSSDQEEQSFTNYYTTMPWLAMIFDENHKRKNLMTMFKIQGIPSLIILDAKTGYFITANGRNDVMKAMSTATATTATNDASTKNTTAAAAAAAVFQSWLDTEAIPLDQVTNFVEGGDGSDSSWLWKAVTFVIKRPAFLFIMYHLMKQIKLYFETMSSSSNKEEDMIGLDL